MSTPSIYRYTSIARPVDPAWPTNRAVLILVPAVALACAALTAAGMSALVEPVPAALSGALVAFGAWALTRELAPDDDPAAFVSMALATVVLLAAGAATVLPLFVALFLVRVVNRSTGQAATVVDTTLVVALTLWAADRLDQPLMALAGAVAFALDGVLGPRSPRQFVAAAFCIAVPGALAIANGLPRLFLVPVPVTDALVLAAILAGFLIAVVGTGVVRSVGDATGQRLSRARVRAGMLVAALIALQSLLSSTTEGADVARWTWCCLAGVAAGRLRQAKAPS